MASACQDGLTIYQPLILTVTQQGGNLSITAQNAGRNIIQIIRIELRVDYVGGSTGMSMLRKPQFYNSNDIIEQFTTLLVYQHAFTNVLRAQAQAEYIEFTGRAISKCW